MVVDSSLEVTEINLNNIFALLSRSFDLYDFNDRAIDEESGKTGIKRPNRSKCGHCPSYIIVRHSEYARGPRKRRHFYCLATHASKEYSISRRIYYISTIITSYLSNTLEGFALLLPYLRYIIDIVLTNCLNLL